MTEKEAIEGGGEQRRVKRGKWSALKLGGVKWEKREERESVESRLWKTAPILKMFSTTNVLDRDEQRKKKKTHSVFSVDGFGCHVQTTNSNELWESRLRHISETKPPWLKWEFWLGQSSERKEDLDFLKILWQNTLGLWCVCVCVSTLNLENKIPVYNDGMPLHCRGTAVKTLLINCVAR